MITLPPFYGTKKSICVTRWQKKLSQNALPKYFCALFLFSFQWQVEITVKNIYVLSCDIPVLSPAIACSSQKTNLKQAIGKKEYDRKHLNNPPSTRGVAIQDVKKWDSIIKNHGPIFP